MKALKISNLTLCFVMLISISTFANGIEPTKDQNLKNMIKEYVTNEKIDMEYGVAKVITNFIIEEDGQRYAVDFMISGNEEIEVISKYAEFEYYRVVDRYNAKFVKEYTVPVSTIK